MPAYPPGHFLQLPYPLPLALLWHLRAMEQAEEGSRSVPETNSAPIVSGAPFSCNTLSIIQVLMSGSYKHP